MKKNLELLLFPTHLILLMHSLLNFLHANLLSVNFHISVQEKNHQKSQTHSYLLNLPHYMKEKREEVKAWLILQRWNM